MHASVQPLEIEPPLALAGASRATRGELQDRQLTARVKAALIAAGEITAKQILIETSNGIVSLSGPVDSEVMKRATLATARCVHGAVSVLDQLFLRDAPDPSCSTLANRLSAREPRP